MHLDNCNSESWFDFMSHYDRRVLLFFKFSVCIAGIVTLYFEGGPESFLCQTGLLYERYKINIEFERKQRKNKIL